MDLLDELRQEGHLILISTHNLGTVPEFCDQVIMINRTILAMGSTKSTFTQANLEKVFGGKNDQDQKFIGIKAARELGLKPIQ